VALITGVHTLHVQWTKHGVTGDLTTAVRLGSADSGKDFGNRWLISGGGGTILQPLPPLGRHRRGRILRLPSSAPLVASFTSCLNSAARLPLPPRCRAAPAALSERLGQEPAPRSTRLVVENPASPRPRHSTARNVTQSRGPGDHARQEIDRSVGLVLTARPHSGRGGQGLKSPNMQKSRSACVPQPLPLRGRRCITNPEQPPVAASQT
jgi:hypothetical protein